MSLSALICVAPGSEETEVVTTIDLMVRSGILVTTASVANDRDDLIIFCSHGVKILADIPLTEITNTNYDIVILPGGMKGTKHFRNSRLLVETIRQFRFSGKIVAAICAVAAMVLIPHNIFPDGKMTGHPDLKYMIPSTQWVDKRVVWDPNVKLLTSQGLGTSIDFALNIINLLIGHEKACEIASSLVIAPGIYNFLN